MMYLDTNIFVYAIENHPEYGKKAKRILEDAEKGKIKGCASMLVLVELLNVLNKINRVLRDSGKKELDLKEMITAIESIPITWFDLNFLIMEKAAEYSYKVNAIDYIHIATMELNSVREIASADRNLDRVDIVKRIDPIGYTK